MQIKFKEFKMFHVEFFSDRGGGGVQSFMLFLRALLSEERKMINYDLSREKTL
jgi:hypothetical protein